MTEEGAGVARAPFIITSRLSHKPKGKERIVALDFVTNMGLVAMIAKRAVVGAMVGLAVTDELASVALMQGRSMEPTLMPGESFWQGDLLLLNKLPAHDFSFSRGDVVVVRCPDDPKCLMVKRLIALEGDMVRSTVSDEVMKVPKGRCWVEGDNAGVSLDSRSIGAIPMALLNARVARVLWPPVRFGKVESAPHTERIVVQKKA